MNVRRCIDTTVLIVCLLFLSSCAAQFGGKVELPVETSMVSKAGEPILVTLHLENGEKLQFLVDTGTHESILDKSLEPSLGRPLGKKKIKSKMLGETDCTVYSAPKLYLGDVALRTDDKVLTDDLSQLFQGRKIKGILGMDCLRNYCIQIDFNAMQVRFLGADDPSIKSGTKAFQLSRFWGGNCVYADFCGVKNCRFVVDTGFLGEGDFMLTPNTYRQVLARTGHNRAGQWGLFTGATGQAACLPRGDFGGLTFENLIIGADAGQGWNWMALHFLTRSVVTLNFPRGMMYLKTDANKSSLDHGI